ncbi:hypothetical protein Pogu_0893 [Pyrobaculum oguniense TE7]|uniref:Uncharacterized protein n=1 Tax=Pyrobaculum oguniense (strain DSM 13380 / JCM 10595 / TE7) TaxID=698757 RepID=H6Q8B3_PYROT|nr:hypothetical protein Pogu_0893 [Pyrobaculum oguniense TE7]
MGWAMAVRRVLALLVLLLVWWVFGIEVEPGFVNAYTYTNLTIRGAENVSGVEGAYVDFVKRVGDGVVLMGLKPVEDRGDVVIKADNKSVRLPVRDFCRIDLEVGNMTWLIKAGAGGSCRDLKLYVNNTLLQGLNVSYVPRYAGVYAVVATNGVFYQKAAVVVIPNVTVLNNVFGEVLTIRLSPPPRSGVVSLGSLSRQAGEAVEFDTWLLGAGNYTLRVTFSGVTVARNVTILRAVPQVEVSYRGEYTYGESVNVGVRVLVGKREYGAGVVVGVGGREVVAKAPVVLSLGLLDAGAYTLSVRVAEDGNITSYQTNVSFKVLPAPVRLDVLINGTFSNPYIVQFGKILIVNAVAKSLVPPIGEVVILIDGRKGGPVIDTLRLGPGAHNLTVAFRPGSANFLPAQLSVALVVTEAAPEIAVNKTISITYGEPLVVPFYVRLFGRPINATLAVQLLGQHRSYNFTVDVVNGVGVLKAVGLAAGTYLATATLKGVQGLIGGSATFNVFVSKALVHVRLEVPKSGVYGEPIPIAVSVAPQVRGEVELRVNGTRIYLTNASSFQRLWQPPRGGVFLVSATFKSLDLNYSDAESATFIYVDRAKCVVRFGIVGDMAGSGELYVLRRYRIAVDSIVPTSILINGTAAGPTVVFNETGIYNITAYFPGDERYYPCGAAEFFKVVKNPVEVLIQTSRRITLVDIGEPLRITIKSPVGRAEGDVLLYKVNKTFNKTEVEARHIFGNTTLELSFGSTGVYDIYVEFLGNEYLEPNRSNIVTLTVEMSVLRIPLFLLTLYISSIVAGLAVGVVVKKIFKKSL